MENSSKFFTSEILSKLVEDIGVAFWVYDILEGKLYYNDAFYKMIGLTDYKECIDLEEWEQFIYAQDKDWICKEIDKFLSMENENYSHEFRMQKENGDIIWVHDKGKYTKFDEKGKPTQISGITQNVTEKKMTEEKFKLAMKFAGFSVWEWDVLNNLIVHDKDYPTLLGYNHDEWGTSIKELSFLIHPEDVDDITNNIVKDLNGIGSSYDNKLRVKKKNGEYIWVRDVGEVFQVDIEGRPSKVIGGRIDIDELETSKLKLQNYQSDLETQIETRTQDLKKRDTILLELNQMFRKLMATPTDVEFDKTVYKYLDEFPSIQNNARVAIYRNKQVEGKYVCYLANCPRTPYLTEYSIEDVREKFKDFSVSRLSNGTFSEEQREEFYVKLLENVNKIDVNSIDVENELPTFFKFIKNNEVLNIKSKNFQTNEIIFTQLQGIQSVLMSPIILNNEFWGYILIDHNDEDIVFSKEDEEILTIVGSATAQAIQKNEVELVAKDAIEHNRLMLDAMPLCCNLWLDGVNISSNDEAVRLFELENQQEYLDKFYLLSPEYQPCGNKSADLVSKRIQKAIDDGWHRFEWMHNKLNGELIPCEITLVKVDYQGTFLIAGYTRDLREFKALLKDIEENQVLLEEAHETALLSSKAKSNFLANMSHEIRTPMNAISGMTDIILRESKDSEVNDYALNIKRASDNLLAIINDVLDISKIESGKLDINEGSYVLSDALDDVMSIANNRLGHKPLMFNTNFQHDLPNNLIGDDIRVKQIMVNLINNAIKFTAKGYIDFNVMGEYADGVLKLQFAVTDTGIGVSEDDLEKLFIEFERVNTTKNRSIEGTGLGLAISKRLCEMMDGEIGVESELGVGTTFTVSIIQRYENYVPIAKVNESKSILVFESRDLYRKSTQLACEQLNLNDSIFCELQSEFTTALLEKEFDYIFTSQMHLTKVQELLQKHKIECKIVLLADNDSVKAKYDTDMIIIPTNTIAIANVLNGKITIYNNQNIVNFTAPDCTVLVVDDNPVNLKVAQGLMRPYKFKIETAENGQEAVEKIKADNKYDLIFMDHMMPIMDGIDATVFIRVLDDDYYKKLPIIALTANAIMGIKEMFIREGMDDFLPKPIQLKALNDILQRWLPKEKQIMIDSSELGQNAVKEITIHDVDTIVGISRVGGDFDTYIDILTMYHKDGVKRVKTIEKYFECKQLLNYKIEVHALKSSSASIGALYISERARLLEESANKENWDYINQNNADFVVKFVALLENIETALKEIVVVGDTSQKAMGEPELYLEILKELCNALDEVEITRSESLLTKLFSFEWDEQKQEALDKIKDFVDGYEYDEAVEVIQEILK